MIKKILATGVAALMMLGAAGCNMVFLNEERDQQTVVATVNGEDILKPEVIELYDVYKSMYGITEDNEDSEDARETVQELKDLLLDAMVDQVLAEQKAAELGLTLTDEEQQEIDDEIEQVLEQIQTSAESYADSAVAADSTIDRDAYIEQEVEYMKENYGINDGSYRESLESDRLIQKLREYTLDGYTPTDEEIQTWYDENLETQREDLQENPANLSTYESSSIVLYQPEGYRYVRDIFISLDDEVQDEIEALRDEGKDDEADALRDEALQAIESEANEAYEKATAEGADFSAVLAEYTDDTGMKSEPAMTTGYRIYEGSTTYNETIVNTGMSLENVGDISEPVATDSGYYIIEYTGDMASGEVPLEDVRDEIEERLISDKTEENYNAAMEQWREEAEITKYYDRLYY